MTISSTSSGSFCSLYFMCSGEVEMKVWMRGALRVLHGLARSGRCPWRTARARPATDGVLHALGDRGHGLEIAVRRRSGNPASMMSTPIASSRSATSQLLLEGHGGAGRLLAVAQGGVEDDDAVLVGGSRGGMRAGVLVLGHCSVLLGGRRACGPHAAKGALKSTPERQGESPGRRSGASKKQTGK